MKKSAEIIFSVKILYLTLKNSIFCENEEKVKSWVPLLNSAGEV